MADEAQNEATWIDRPFLPLFCDALVMALEAQKGDKGGYFSRSFSRSAISVCAFAVEAAANGALRQHPTSRPFRDDIDRLPWLSKFEFLLLTRDSSRTLDRGHTSIQEVGEIFDLRNRMAHGKTRHLRLQYRKVTEGADYEFNKDEGATSMLNIPKQPDSWKPEHSLKAFRAIVNFMNHFMSDLCRFTPKEAQRFLACEIQRGNHYSLMISKDEIAIVKKMRSELNLEIKFLDLEPSQQND